MTQRLNQVLAVEKQAKTKAHREITELHRATAKPQLFNGFSKTYKPLEEDGEHYPPESFRVQMDVQDALKKVQNILGEVFDVTATKDKANQAAKADLVVDGEVLAKDLPATTLLFIEKQLNDIHTFVDKLPTLDQAQEWSFDTIANLWKTQETKTTKTKKVAKPIVLYPATPEHPAQTQMTTEDQIVGHWVKIDHSSALPPTRKSELLERIERLQKATKYARESANRQDAPEQAISAKVFGYLLK